MSLMKNFKANFNWKSWSLFLKAEGVPFLKFICKASALILLGPFMSCSSGKGGAAVTISLNIQTINLINASILSCSAQFSQGFCATGTTPTSVTVPTTDVSAISMSIPAGSMTINWSYSSSPFTLVYIAFVLKGNAISGGSFNGTLTIPELGYAWASSNYNAGGQTSNSSCTPVDQFNPSISSSATSLPTATTSYGGSWYTQNECAISIGGISLVDKSKTATGSGTIYVYGTYKSGNTVQAATAQYPFTYYYLGNGSGS